MIVVADTSPINYLIQLKLDQLLQQLYREILIPDEVAQELRATGAPVAVRRWADHFPYWVTVRTHALSLETELADLDPGERAAIELAFEVHASTLLLDDLQARHIAQGRFGFKVTGTLGVLRDAHRAGMVDGRAAYASLCAETNFYRDEVLERTFLKSLL